MTNDNKMIYELTLGRSGVGAICGAGTIVLAILGLLHLMPVILVSIATIVLGASLFFRGAVVSAEYTKLLSHLSGTSSDKLELGGGVSVEIITGSAVIVLGILSLIGLGTATFIPIAIIVAGCGVVMGTGVISRLNSLKLGVSGSVPGSHHHRIAEDIVSTAMGTQLLAGVGAVVLGILALIGLTPMVLNFVGLLALGGSTLLSSTAITGKFFSTYTS